jgi:plasmid stability protein
MVQLFTVKADNLTQHANERAALQPSGPYAVIRSNDGNRDAGMATVIVRNLDDEVVRRPRVRAAEHGRSAEAEHREILRSALLEAEPHQRRVDAAARLAEFRRRTAGRGSPPSAQLLDESRTDRLQSPSGVGG